MLTLNPAVMELAPWSPSMADQAIGCPHAFQRRYILKEAAIEAKAHSASVGTLVHHVLEWTLRTKEPLSVDAAFKEAFDTLDPPYEVYLQARTYRDAIKDFLKGMRRFDEKFGIVKSYTEVKVALTPEFKLGDYTGKNAEKPLIRGNIDYLVLTRTGRAAIFDHKTGAVKSIDLYDSQTHVYSLLADALLPGVKYTRMGIHYVGADPNHTGGRTVWAPEYPIETVRTVFRDKVIKYLNDAAACAQLNETRVGWRCNYCDYRSACSAPESARRSATGP